MTRYKLTVEYDGAGFVGWQRQTNGLSVQEALECAVHEFCGEQARVHGAGRTDSGVHALGQVCHVDIARPTRPDKVRDALNAHLRPHPAAVLTAEEVAPDFDARRSAIGRVYRYRLINRRAPLTLNRGRAWWVGARLDHDAMARAARHLIGQHDFTSFRASVCQARSPVRTLDRLDVIREGEEIAIWAEARSFLHHQVRNIVGTLRLVGDGSWRDRDVADALAARQRAAAGPTAPPDGLYLVRVVYP